MCQYVYSYIKETRIDRYSRSIRRKDLKCTSHTLSKAPTIVVVPSTYSQHLKRLLEPWFWVQTVSKQIRKILTFCIKIVLRHFKVPYIVQYINNRGLESGCAGSALAHQFLTSQHSYRDSYISCLPTQIIIVPKPRNNFRWRHL